MFFLIKSSNYQLRDIVLKTDLVVRQLLSMSSTTCLMFSNIKETITTLKVTGILVNTSGLAQSLLKACRAGYTNSK